MLPNVTKAHKMPIMPGECVTTFPALIDLVLGFSVGILFVVDVSNSTCEVVNGSVDLTVLMVE